MKICFLFAWILQPIILGFWKTIAMNHLGMFSYSRAHIVEMVSTTLAKVYIDWLVKWNTFSAQNGFINQWVSYDTTAN